MQELEHAIEHARTQPAAYVLAGEGDDYLYKGSCRDLVARLKDHRAGRVRSTKNRRPLRLAYVEYCPTYQEARRREGFLKSGVGRELLVRRIAERRAEPDAG